MRLVGAELTLGLGGRGRSPLREQRQQPLPEL